MQLIDGRFYTLPDGTRVQYRVPLIGSARLVADDGQPVYLFDAALGCWRALRYNAVTDAYEAAACDLVDTDVLY